MYTIGLWEFLELHSNLKDSDDGTGKTPHCLESESFIPGDYVYWIIWSLRLDASGLHPPLFLNIGEPGHKLTGKFEKWITTCPLSVMEHAKRDPQKPFQWKLSRQSFDFNDRSRATHYISGLRSVDPGVMHSTPFSICDISRVGHLRYRQSACCQCAHHRGKS